VIVEHRTLGDVQMRVANVSAHGFMVDDATNLSRGDRIIIRLPVIGRIEAYVIWMRDNSRRISVRTDHPSERLRSDDRRIAAKPAPPPQPLNQTGASQDPWRCQEPP
jgi:hypothetical protein